MCFLTLTSANLIRHLRYVPSSYNPAHMGSWQLYAIRFFHAAPGGWLSFVSAGCFAVVPRWRSSLPTNGCYLLQLNSISPCLMVLQVSSPNLERVRRIKNNLVRLTTRVETIREVSGGLK